MKTAPPLPSPPPEPRSLIITAYICSGLSIVPCLGLVTALAGIILGIVLCVKRQVGHGIANIAISGLLTFFVVPALTLVILTAMADDVQEIFQRITTQLETQPVPAPEPESTE